MRGWQGRIGSKGVRVHGIQGCEVWIVGSEGVREHRIHECEVGMVGSDGKRMHGIHGYEVGRVRFDGARERCKLVRCYSRGLRFIPLNSMNPTRDVLTAEHSSRMPILQRRQHFLGASLYQLRAVSCIMYRITYANIYIIHTQFLQEISSTPIWYAIFIAVMNSICISNIETYVYICIFLFQQVYEYKSYFEIKNINNKVHTLEMCYAIYIYYIYFVALGI